MSEPDGRGDPHVLVARLDNAGDVLLTGPTVRAIAASGAWVTYLCGPSGRAAAALLPGVNAVVELDAPWVPLEPGPFDGRAIDRFLAQVAADRPDQAVICTSFHQSPLPLALLLRMAGVASIAACSGDHPGALVDHRRRPEHDDRAHEVERSLRLAATLGYGLPQGDDGRMAVRRPLPSRPAFGEGYAVVHPGASVPARGIPADTARRLVERLADHGHRVVVTGGPNEQDLVRTVAGTERDEVSALIRPISLAALAGVLDRASVVVTGNTGPAHLAAAVGTPVVSVFAPVVALQQWAPWRVPSVVLGDQTVPCAGCRARSCPLPSQLCLEPVTADALTEAAERWLGAQTQGRAPQADEPHAAERPANELTVQPCGS